MHALTNSLDMRPLLLEKLESLQRWTYSSVGTNMGMPPIHKAKPHDEALTYVYILDT